MFQTPDRAPYDFPVHLENAYTQAGSQIPRVKAVLRDDTGQIIAAVSGRYELVTHAEVMDVAMPFFREFGTPETKFDVAADGAVMMGSFTYREKPVEVALGETVGLRLYLQNSYNGETAVRLQLGALVLSCLNGAVSSRSIFNVSHKHTKKIRLQFPDPGRVWDAFDLERKKWANYMGFELSGEAYQSAVKGVWAQGIIREQLVPELSDKRQNSVWGLMQDLTHNFTHKEDKLTPMGRIRKLQAVSRFFDERFQSLIPKEGVLNG